MEPNDLILQFLGSPSPTPIPPPPRITTKTQTPLPTTSSPSPSPSSTNLTVTLPHQTYTAPLTTTALNHINLGRTLITALTQPTSTFLTSLTNEIKTNFTNSEPKLRKLNQALTTTEHTHTPNPINPSLIKQGFVRGDKTLYIPHTSPSFPIKSPYFFSLITTLIKKVNSAYQTGLNGTVSVQLATYDEGGKGYVRHCDVQGHCCAGDKSKSSNNKEGGVRVLTVIYYLGDLKDDEEGEIEGGHLRVYDKSNDDSYEDIAPTRGKLVIFKSNAVPHEVLKTVKGVRGAVTLWFYGTEDADDNDNGGVYDAQDKSSPLPLPIPKSTSESVTKEETIFVSIPSFRDLETQETVLNLYWKALHPDRVFVGICSQHDTSSAAEYNLLYSRLTDLVKDGKVRISTIDYKHATGPCTARAQSQGLSRGEDYLLQVDSHMRFRSNWDVYLIDCLRQAEYNNSDSDIGNAKKVVISTYPPGYTLPNNVPSDTSTTVLFPSHFAGTETHGLLRLKGRTLNSARTRTSKNAVIKSPFPLIAAGFNFSRLALTLIDVPYPPDFHGVFFGEELYLSFKYYVEGYSFYCTRDNVCFHLWERGGSRLIDSENGNGDGWRVKSKWLESKTSDNLNIIRSMLTMSIEGKAFAKELNVDFEACLMLGGDGEDGEDEKDADFEYSGGLKESDFRVKNKNGKGVESFLEGLLGLGLKG